MNTQNVTLDLSKSHVPNPLVRIGQGDKGGTTIRATVLDNGVAANLSGATAAFEIQLPNRGFYEDENCTVSGNVITHVLDERYSASYAGYTDDAYFKITIGTNVYSTSRFRVKIEKDAASDADPAESYSDNITKATQAARDAANAANAAVESISGAVEDAETAVENATQAVTQANTAVASANAANDKATQAASTANNAASQATQAASNANAASTRANAATTSANQAAGRTEAAIAAVGDISRVAVPLMSEDVRGGAMVGDGLVVSDGYLSVDWRKVASMQKLDALSHRVDGIKILERDSDGYYVNSTITAWLALWFDGKIYGYSEPKTTATAITKTGANAGLPNPTLGTLDTEGQSVYRNLGPFQWHACKGHVDSDGVPHIKVIWGVDTLADWQACTENVWSMRPIVYYSIDESDPVSANALVSDTWHTGLKPNKHAYLPDGTLRPFMLAGRHGLGFEDGVGVSKPGLKGYGRNVSHNSLITLLKYTSTGYSAKTDYEDWYDKFMFRMIYGTKDSQSVMRGCTGYSYQYHPAVAEQGVKRVILTNAQADSLVIGSTMMMGNQATASTDRNNANCYNVFDGLVIASIEEYDSSRKAVYFDTDATFDTDPAYLLSTAPWHTGSCDGMDWDGTPTAAGATSGKEPMFFQGCELMNGNYEILGNVILSSDGESGWIPYVNPDTKNEKTALSSDYVSCETSLPVGSADSWKHPLYLSERSGMMYGTQTGGSQSTGICDGHYTNKMSTAGTREWPSLGHLSNGGAAGLACVSGDGGLGGAGWSIWSRLSGVGRSRAAA